MNIESLAHGISQFPNAFFGALAQGERTISKLLNAFLDEKKKQNEANRSLPLYNDNKKLSSKWKIRKYA